MKNIKTITLMLVLAGAWAGGARGMEADTRLRDAIERGDIESVKYLVEIERVKYNPTIELTDAIYCGHLDIFKYFLKRDENHVHYKILPPISIATAYNRLHLIEYLVEEEGVSVNATGDSRLTPLHRAAQNGHLHIMKYLISKEADPTIKTYRKHCCSGCYNCLDNGKTPLEILRDRHPQKYKKFMDWYEGNENQEERLEYVEENFELWSDVAPKFMDNYEELMNDLD